MTAKDDTERSADSTIRPEDADPDEGLDTATGRVAGGAAVAGTAVNGLVAAILPTSLVPSTHLWELAYYIDRYRSHSHRISAHLAHPPKIQRFPDRMCIGVVGIQVVTRL